MLFDMRQPPERVWVVQTATERYVTTEPPADLTRYTQMEPIGRITRMEYDTSGEKLRTWDWRNGKWADE